LSFTAFYSRYLGAAFCCYKSITSEKNLDNLHRSRLLYIDTLYLGLIWSVDLSTMALLVAKSRLYFS